MSWFLSARVSSEQDVDTRLEEATHEFRDHYEATRDDVRATVEAAKVLAGRIEERPITISMGGHRGPGAPSYINVNITHEING